MKNIKFTENEINELKNLYKIELAKSLKRIEDIRRILEKFGDDESEEMRPSTSLSSFPELESQIFEEETDPEDSPYQEKQKGRKSKWGKFILQTIKQQDTLLSSNELVRMAMIKFNIGEYEREKIRQAISASLYRLTNVGEQLIALRTEGERSGVYGLPEWFAGKNELVEPYKSQFQPFTESGENEPEE